ncbi:MAG: hypothetical protein M3349_02620 [Actinomycetota bacterium]|nr:hypothetical protein [Actinomycetota bacterium]
MPMSQEHKEALAQGRRESRAIRAYLGALGERRPGRPVSADSLERRLGDVETKLGGETNPLRRVGLIQSRIDLRDRLSKAQDASNIAELEDSFVDHVAGYSDRRGVSYDAWREAGVPAKVLKRAGLGRKS